MNDVNKFGNEHTLTKLNCVKSYLDGWATVLKKQGFNKRYIDAFSGSGHFVLSTDPSEIDHGFLDDAEIGKVFLDGSPLQALDVRPSFDKIDLIEKNPSAVASLREAIRTRDASYVEIHQEDANIALPRICEGFSRKDRAVVFLDPFGAQVEWSTLEAVSATRAADLWYLVPVSIINRMLPRKFERQPTGWSERITACLGTDEWITRFYQREDKTDLFGEVSETSKRGGLIDVERFFIERLKTVFPGVANDAVRLITPRGTHLFSLCFAVANPRGNAPEIALKIANSVIRKWGGRNG